LNGLEGVVVHEIALADREGLMQLNRNDGDSTTSISPPAREPRDGTSSSTTGDWVKAGRLDRFAWPRPFAYIKIDVEGAEQLVLSGSEQILLHGVPMVWSFEYLDTQQRLGSSKAALLEAFAQWNYSFYLYRPASNRLVPFLPDPGAAHPAREDDNVLAIHASALDQTTRRLCGLE